MQTKIAPPGGRHDFDFLFGTWRVRNRRLRSPLQGSDDWYEFDAEFHARPIWDGKANMDEFIADSPLGPIEGLTLRLYDAVTGKWSLYWATSRSGLAVVPNVGTFNEDGTGEFFSNETFEGETIVCRYSWARGDEQRCRWEQAFSTDGGSTWETNWIMEFTRT